MTNDHFKELFKEEIFELLTELESSLLELEETPNNEELIACAFRTMHTIKGTGAMFGFNQMKAFAHEIENIFEIVNQGKISLSQELIDLTLAGCDHIRTMVSSAQEGTNDNEKRCHSIVTSLQRLSQNPKDSETQTSDDFTHEPTIDPSIHKLLSTKEEVCLRRKLEQKKNIFISDLTFLEINYVKTLTETIERYKREVEFISVLPGFKKLPSTKIGFRILFASDKDPQRLQDTLGNKPVELAVFGDISYPNSHSECHDDSAAAQQNVLTTYRMRFRLNPGCMKQGLNPLSILHDLHHLGHTTVVAHTEDIPFLEEIEPDLCYAFWDVLLTTTKGINAIKDVFIFFEDECEFGIQIIHDEGKNYKKLGEILIERGDLTATVLQKTLGTRKPIGEILLDAGLVSSGNIQAALIEQNHLRSIQEKQKIQKPTFSIRVSSPKMDRLVDLVGELVTVQARLSQTAMSRKDSDLLIVSEEIERLTGELRDNTMSIRMLPIGTTLFSKFKRLVRDLSIQLGKEIELTMEGAETELDKSVIEQLNDPLIHMIRNCIDHGIEEPDKREKKGKPRKGTIRMSASHAGANVLIQIKDDGQGLNKEDILAKALENQLITSERDLTEKEIWSLIFQPGFSTSKEVTDVSGRGVGLDVVKKNIESLRGSIEILSEKNQGTTFTLRLPLTLAIIDGLLVTVGQEYFVVPLTMVEECIELTEDDISKIHGKHLVHLRGKIVPYIRLREELNHHGTRPAIEQVVVVKADGVRMGLVVDHVIGKHQTVMKKMCGIFKYVDIVSGATILGDGRVALILDVPKLMHSAERREKERCQAGLPGTFSPI